MRNNQSRPRESGTCGGRGKDLFFFEVGFTQMKAKRPLPGNGLA